MKVRFYLDWRNTVFVLDTEIPAIPAIARRIRLPLGDETHTFVMLFDDKNGPEFIPSENVTEITLNFADEGVHEGEAARRVRQALSRVEPNKEMGWRKFTD